MALYPTPHINASPQDFAKTVLMPGDPVRAKMIAEKYFENPVLVNNVRGICGYTGRYKGSPISVMASGMGMPSMGIYSYELFNIFGVQNIIRIGTAGGISEKVRVKDLVLAIGACTDSNYAAQYSLPGAFAPTASFEILEKCVNIAKKSEISYHIGNIVTSDAFYSGEENSQADANRTLAWGKMGVLAVEMETAALYMNAARAGKNALAVCTVSDHLLTGESTSSDERAYKMTQMIELALETSLEL